MCSRDLPVTSCNIHRQLTMNTDKIATADTNLQAQALQQNTLRNSQSSTFNHISRIEEELKQKVSPNQGWVYKNRFPNRGVVRVCG